MSNIKKGEDLERMRRSCRLAARILATLVARVGPGVTTGELDELAAAQMKEHGGESAFRGYRGYPAHICVSINEEVVHGIPGRRRIALGDIVSLDVGVYREGFIGDTAATVMVGVTDPDVIRLVRGTQEALGHAIAAAREGNRVGDISHAVEQCARGMGFSVVHDLTGHGVGRKLHEDPPVPNFGAAGDGPTLKAGMTLALEPMVNLGGSAVDVGEDGWTVRTRDRRPSAHFEHTVLVGEAGGEVLTRGGDWSSTSRGEGDTLTNSPLGVYR